jgi:hypothetical protein
MGESKQMQRKLTASAKPMWALERKTRKDEMGGLQMQHQKEEIENPK